MRIDRERGPDIANLEPAIAGGGVLTSDTIRKKYTSFNPQIDSSGNGRIPVVKSMDSASADGIPSTGAMKDAYSSFRPESSNGNTIIIRPSRERLLADQSMVEENQEEDEWIKNAKREAKLLEEAIRTGCEYVHPVDRKREARKKSKDYVVQTDFSFPESEADESNDSEIDESTTQPQTSANGGGVSRKNRIALMTGGALAAGMLVGCGADTYADDTDIPLQTTDAPKSETQKEGESISYEMGRIDRVFRKSEGASDEKDQAAYENYIRSFGDGPEISSIFFRLDYGSENNDSESRLYMAIIVIEGETFTNIIRSDFDSNNVPDIDVENVHIGPEKDGYRQFFTRGEDKIEGVFFPGDYEAGMEMVIDGTLVVFPASPLSELTFVPGINSRDGGVNFNAEDMDIVYTESDSDIQGVGAGVQAAEGVSNAQKEIPDTRIDSLTVLDLREQFKGVNDKERFIKFLSGSYKNEDIVYSEGFNNRSIELFLPASVADRLRAEGVDPLEWFQMNSDELTKLARGAGQNIDVNVEKVLIIDDELAAELEQDVFFWNERDSYPDNLTTRWVVRGDYSLANNRSASGFDNALLHEWSHYTLFNWDIYFLDITEGNMTSNIRDSKGNLISQDKLVRLCNDNLLMCGGGGEQSFSNFERASMNRMRELGIGTWKEAYDYWTKEAFNEIGESSVSMSELGLDVEEGQTVSIFEGRVDRVENWTPQVVFGESPSAVLTVNSNGNINIPSGVASGYSYSEKREDSPPSDPDRIMSYGKLFVIVVEKDGEEPEVRVISTYDLLEDKWSEDVVQATQ